MIPNLYVKNDCFTKHPFTKWLFGVPGWNRLVLWKSTTILKRFPWNRWFWTLTKNLDLVHSKKDLWTSRCLLFLSTINFQRQTLGKLHCSMTMIPLGWAVELAEIISQNNPPVKLGGSGSMTKSASPLKIRLWDPFQMFSFKWRINGGSIYCLLTGMILLK